MSAWNNTTKFDVDLLGPGGVLINTLTPGEVDGDSGEGHRITIRKR
jgi:hypothetical protein